MKREFPKNNKLPLIPSTAWGEKCWVKCLTAICISTIVTDVTNINQMLFIMFLYSYPLLPLTSPLSYIYSLLHNSLLSASLPGLVFMV